MGDVAAAAGSLPVVLRCLMCGRTPHPSEETKLVGGEDRRTYRCHVDCWNAQMAKTQAKLEEVKAGKPIQEVVGQRRRRRHG